MSLVENTAAPFGEVGPQAVTCRCGREQHPVTPERCAAGHPWKGLPGPALVVGSHSAAFWREHEDVRRDLRAVILSDAGYTIEDAPRTLVIAAESIAQAMLIRDSAYQRLAEAGGPLASSGRVRRAFDAWVQASDRLERYIRLVGLQRRSRPALNVAEQLAQFHQEPRR